MKTKFYYLMMCISFVIAAMAFASCGDDDETQPKKDWGNPGKSIVGTGAAVNITPSTVTIQCSLNKQYAIGCSSKGVDIFLDKSMTISAENVDRVEESAISSKFTYTCTFRNLKPKTTYYYRAKAKINQWFYGEMRSFTTPDINITATNELVDMGLRVKWSSVNYGASSPEKLGTLFNWTNATDYGQLLEGSWKGNSQFDMVYKQSGGKYETPTTEDWKELIDKCGWIKYTYQSVRGWAVCGLSGNTIFIPNGKYLHSNGHRGMCYDVLYSNITDDSYETKVEYIDVCDDCGEFPDRGASGPISNSFKNSFKAYIRAVK